MARPKDPSLAGKTERIDTRVSPATRKALEEAAATNGVSLSREIEERLRASLADEGADGAEGRKETGYLLYGLRLVIEYAEKTTGEKWTSDAFTRDAVGDALRWFVKFYGPALPMEPPTPPAAFPTFIPDGHIEELDIGKREFANQLIKGGFGKFCAETIVHRLHTETRSTELAPHYEQKSSIEQVVSSGLSRLMIPEIANRRRRKQ